MSEIDNSNAHNGMGDSADPNNHNNNNGNDNLHNNNHHHHRNNDNGIGDFVANIVDNNNNNNNNDDAPAAVAAANTDNEHANAMNLDDVNNMPPTGGALHVAEHVPVADDDVFIDETPAPTRAVFNLCYSDDDTTDDDDDVAFNRHVNMAPSGNPFDMNVENVLTIEDIRNHLGTCFSCGVSWTDDHVSLDCSECGGYSLERPCPLCDGGCGVIWKRDFTMSHACANARWLGVCPRFSSGITLPAPVGSNAGPAMGEEMHYASAASIASDSAEAGVGAGAAEPRIEPINAGLSELDGAVGGVPVANNNNHNGNSNMLPEQQARLAAELRARLEQLSGTLDRA